MAIPNHARSAPEEASRLSDDLAALDQLLHELRDAERPSADQLLDAISALDARLHAVREHAASLEQALSLIADDEVQARLRSFHERLAGAKPLRTVPVDDVIERLRERQADLGA